MDARRVDHSPATRQRAAKAFAHTAQYDGMVADYCAPGGGDATAAFPETCLPLVYEKAGPPTARTCTSVAPISDRTRSPATSSTMLHGKELCPTTHRRRRRLDDGLRQFRRARLRSLKHATRPAASGRGSMPRRTRARSRTDPEVASAAFLQPRARPGRRRRRWTRSSSGPDRTRHHAGTRCELLRKRTSACLSAAGTSRPACRRARASSTQGGQWRRVGGCRPAME